jgi:integrase
MMQPLTDRFDRWVKSLKPETGKVYGRYARRVFTAMNLTPDEALEKVKQEASTNRWDTYSDLLNTVQLTEHGRYQATYAVRSFLFFGGLMMLPPTRISEPELVKERTRLSWDEALAICAAASKPYNLAFKMMLHCGWGSGEFLRFNVAQNWERIKTQLVNGNGQEYVRIEMPRGRKKNRSPFYSLIPVGLVKEVLASGIQIPFTASHGYALDENHKRINKVAGISLDMAHHDSARLYLEKAFATALKRAPITVAGKPTPHELRDTFRTHAHHTQCDEDVANFAMGHEIDPDRYDKICEDEAYVWKNLKKLYGPSPAQIDEVAEENKQLKERLKKLEQVDIWDLIFKNPEKLSDLFRWGIKQGMISVRVLTPEEEEQYNKGLAQEETAKDKKREFPVGNSERRE